MENKSREVEKLLAESKKLREISKLKQNLQDTLAELTICNNVAILSKRLNMFSAKVLKVSCKVVSSPVPSLEGNQTLVITVQNVSETIVFNCEHWQFCVSLNHDRTQSTWNLDKSLGPGQTDTFCSPLSTKFPVERISVSLKFVIQYESKSYTRSFDIQECIVDALHCLDPGRIVSEQVSEPLFTQESSFLNLCMNKEPTASFHSIKKILLKLDTLLKERFIKDILLRDSRHRGFSDCIDELASKPEISVFYFGSQIDIKLDHKYGFIAIKSNNPTVLCVVKAAILRRLVTVPGITVEGLDDKNLEKVHNISLRLSAFESDCNPDSLDVNDLMELYLELRDVSESIRFSVVEVVE